MRKTFIGPHLRRLRLERGETQGAMAKSLGISASYVNLLENNERSVSVQVLLRLFESYGVDWREIVEEDGASQLADLRVALQDPIFAETRPDLPQLRAALVHSPDLAGLKVRRLRSPRPRRPPSTPSFGAIATTSAISKTRPSGSGRHRWSATRSMPR
jgi:XRE family transcriptional regulator, fatty acid utilization regulator